MKEIVRKIIEIFLRFMTRVKALFPVKKNNLLLMDAKNTCYEEKNELNNQLISVIVPVYNVDRYLKRCLDSIINQTYKNLEIILVDDGSTDKSADICDEYFKKDPRIIVIHKQNGGLSSARNAGLEIAKGALIGFVDSDDYIDQTMYEKLKESMDKYGSDIAVCRFYKKFRYFKRDVDDLNDIHVYQNGEKFKNIEHIRIVAWNKLYKKEIFKKIRYPNGKIYEDNFILCDILNTAKKISFVNETLYNYVMRNSSITKANTEKYYHSIEASDTVIEFAKKHHYISLRTRIEYNKVFRIIEYAYRMNLNSLNDENIKEYVNSAVRIAQRLKNSKYLRENERNNINLFLQDKELFYKNYKFKSDIKKYMKNVVLYK